MRLRRPRKVAVDPRELPERANTGQTKQSKPNHSVIKRPLLPRCLMDEKPIGPSRCVLLKVWIVSPLWRRP